MRTGLICGVAALGALHALAAPENGRDDLLGSVAGAVSTVQLAAGTATATATVGDANTLSSLVVFNPSSFAGPSTASAIAPQPESSVSAVVVNPITSSGQSGFVVSTTATRSAAGAATTASTSSSATSLGRTTATLNVSLALAAAALCAAHMLLRFA